jgi:ribonuclease HI
VPLTAKYPTPCGVCSSVINPGDEISKIGRRWAHVSCVTLGQDALPLTEPTRLDGSAQRAPRKPMAAAAGALEVWTDGACSGNPGPGGWAWATEEGRQASGGALATTNQRMEIQAALEAVRALDGPLIVVSDSTYVVNCFRDGWWRAWLTRGWLNSGKKPVANRDLWEPLIIAVHDRADISFRWVKGHSGDPMNDMADRLAVEAMRAVAGSPMAGGGRPQ